MSHGRVIVIGVLLLAGGLIATSDAQLTDRRPGIVGARVYGLTLFGEHCASCHGTSGRGDGPRATTLIVRPRDLTHLAESNQWVFDAARVARAIDGAEHRDGTGEMPRWGEVFRGDAGDTAAAERLEALALYLEFIQVKRPRR